MALFFVCVWASPGWFGWASMSELRAVVWVEVLAVYGFLFMLAGRDAPNDWVSVVYVAGFVCVVLAVTVNPIVALLLSLHLVVRVASLRGDRDSSASMSKGVAGSAFLMLLCWLAVGALPLPPLGWTESVTPLALWWDVPTLTGLRRIPFALPTWAFLYFFVLFLVGVWKAFVRFVERTAHRSTPGAA
jgi:hypothetical protein